MASAGVEEMWAAWVHAKREQWAKGRAEHAEHPGAPFKGNAADEAAMELVDFSNYADQMLREGRISEDERGHVESVAFEFFLWCHRVKQEGCEGWG